LILVTILMAFREIRRHGLRSMLTALGIIIGVAAVIALVTLGRGATAQVTADIAGMGTNLLIVSPGNDHRGPASQGARGFDLADARAIARDVRAVRAVAPSAGGSALVVAGNKNWSTTITGTTREFFTIRGFSTERGALFGDAEDKAAATVCVLGSTVREKLFGKQNPIRSTIRVGAIACTVIGTLKAKGRSGFGPDPDDFLVVPLATYQRRIAGKDEVGSIFVAATSDRSTTKAKAQIESLLRERRRITSGQPSDFSVQDMKEMAQTMSSVTGTLTALLGAIAGVSLVVGGIGIMNIMLVSVTERTREIGLRLAIGARAVEVMTQFLVEAVMLSSFGGAVGVAVGLGASFAAGRALHLPFVIVPGIIVVAFAFSATIGVVFGFLPARRASRLNPIEALRHE
jgi:putative ABC transport system permease protein